MSDKNEEPKNMSILAKFGIGAGGTAFITLLLVVIVPFGLSNWDKIWTRADKLAEQKRKEDAEFENKVRDHVALQSKLDKGVKAYEFSLCWRNGTCEGITQLPIDTIQNSRLEALEKANASWERFIKAHCQTHRDKGDREQDCSKF